MDLASFFDTVSPAVVPLASVGAPAKMASYILEVYKWSNATVRTAAGAASTPIWRGFKQGGRFSTTAARIALVE